MKKIVFSILAIFFVMLALPFLTVITIRSDAGFAITVILFFIVNPLFTAGLGVFSGFNLRKGWFLPILSSIVFLLSHWLIFSIDVAFLLYSSVYLAIGLVAMLVTYLIRR